MNSLHYLSYGPVTAKPLVFLHGFLGSAEDWAETIESFTRSYRCILVDLPGHGKSVGYSDPGMYSFEGACAAVCALVDELLLRDPTLIGYSMGGRLALSMAMTSARFGAAVITSASPGLEMEGEREARRAWDQALAERILTQPLPQFLQDWYGGPLFKDFSGQKDLLNRTLERRGRNDPGELALSLRGMSLGVQPSIWNRLAGGSIPMMFIAGEQDDRYSKLMGKMAALVPGARLEIIPECGHALHVERPSTYANSIQSFLESLPAT